MKNFNFFLGGGVHWKIRLLRGGHEKPIYRGDCLKRGARTVCLFQGGLGKKEGGGVFERGGWYPNAHYVGGVLYKGIVSNFASNIKRI